MFWEQFWPQLIATLIGAVFGIPLGILLERKIAEGKETERRERVLKVIKTNLKLNHNDINEWKQEFINGKDQIYFVNIEVYRGLLDGGELQWLKNPELIDVIANAYYFLEQLRFLAQTYFSVMEFPGTQDVINSFRIKIPPLLDNTMKSIDKALKEINNNLGVDHLS